MFVKGENSFLTELKLFLSLFFYTCNILQFHLKDSILRKRKKLRHVNKYQIIRPICIWIIFRTGIFSLSIERGLVEIGSCRQKGFHQHNKTPPLFEVSGANIMILFFSLFLKEQIYSFFQNLLDIQCLGQHVLTIAMFWYVLLMNN